ncbi:6-bladed beta-propeller [candidate division KSB1 bacterium]
MFDKISLKKSLFVILLIILFISCSSNEYPMDIKYENGIKVVNNPDFPKLKTKEVKQKELLSIGEEEGEKEYNFFRISDINIDGKGNIYVVDWSEREVRVFDKDGNFVKTIGRSGQGPGEFSEPSRIFINSENIIYVFDSQNGLRVTRFSSGYEYIDHKTFGFGKVLIGIDNEDDLFLTNRLDWEYYTGKEKRSFERLDQNGEIISTLVTLEGQNGTPVPDGGLWRTGYEHGAINYALKSNGDLIAGSSDKYIFSVYDKFGNLKMKFGREYEPIPVTDADRNKLSKDQKRKKIIPSKKPAFRISYYRFLIDNENNFWVLTFEKESEGITFDVFDEEGVYIQKAFFKFNNFKLNPILFDDGILYAIHIDENGVNRVKGYKLDYLFQ